MEREILVADDDRHVCELIDLYCRKDGIAVRSVGDGPSVLTAYQERRPHLVVLDVMLPGGLDGFELCRRLRQLGETPIIMLTARGDEVDRILGLELGSDDYVVKPFSPRELVARIRAVLRRSVPGGEGSESEPLLQLGPLQLDTRSRLVSLDGSDLHLTPKEYDLLALLAAHPLRVFTREQLLEQVWGYDFFGDQRTVDVHVKRLRKKLGEPVARWIETVWGIGYRFAVR